MKILIISQQFYPEEFKINEIVEELTKRNHKVTVLTGLPNYPSGIVPKEYRLFRNRKQNYKGAKVIRCFEIGRRNGALGLMMNYLSFMLSSSLKSIFMRKDFDVVMVYQLTPVTMVLPGIIVSKIKNIKLFTYCLDLWPESVKTIINSEDSIIFRGASFISRFMYKFSDKIAVTSKPFIDYFKNIHHIEVDKLTYLPQPSEQITEDLEAEDNNITDFMFMGNIGKAQNIETILLAAKKIEDEDFIVHFVGEGSEFENTKQMVKDLNIEDKIIFHGRHPYSEMNKFYKKADVCILTLTGNSVIGLTMPAKLQGYMSASKPVLGAMNGAAQEVINDACCGYCVNAGDIDLFSIKMKEYIKMSHKERVKMGKSGKSYFDQNFTIDKYIENLEIELNKLV